MKPSPFSLYTLGIAAALCGGPARSDVFHVVSPSAAENADGDLSRPAVSSPLRIQFLFPASDFAAVPESQRYITGMNWRSDPVMAQESTWTFPDREVWFSTTDQDLLSQVFDDNHGPDKQLVFDGATEYRLLTSGPDGGPRDFAPGPRFHAPFYYDPSQGNLLIEVRDFAGTTTIPIPSVDLQSTPMVNILSINEPFNPIGDFIANRLPVLRFDFGLPGDANGDGNVDLADFNALKEHFGTGTGLAEGDFNGDDTVNLADFNILKEHFGEGGGAAVPEPATWLMMLVGAAALGCRFVFLYRRGE